MKCDSKVKKGLLLSKAFTKYQEIAQKSPHETEGMQKNQAG